MTIVENAETWPAMLHNAEEIVRYLSVTDNYLAKFDDPSYHDCYWDEQVEDGCVGEGLKRFEGCTAPLRRVKLQGLIPNNGYVDDEQVDEYESLPSEPPPIVVWGKDVLEGNHRVQVAMRKGQSDILAYVINPPAMDPL